MNPWHLMAILEKSDQSFQDLWFPKSQHCRLEKRIVKAIEENWPVYFPARKECRGKAWSISIPENKPLYAPRADSVELLNQWKKDIAGSFAEGRAYRADTSWRRFFETCKNYERLHSHLRDFRELAVFLINEESMWPRTGGAAIGMDAFLKNWLDAIQAPTSPYVYADPQRLRFLKSKKPPMEKIRMIDRMAQLLDFPLMALAVLQQSASHSSAAPFWLDLQKYFNALILSPTALTFRRTWLEHAMVLSGAIKKSGKCCPRKWAGVLVAGKDPGLSNINSKAIEVNGWLKGKKQPSVENIRRSWRAVGIAAKLTPTQAEAGRDHWLFSWMVALFLESHFKAIESEFAGDALKMKKCYRRFFVYLKIDFKCGFSKRLAGIPRQP